MDVGYLWTHLPEPPWGSIMRTSSSSTMQPFTPLAPPSWAAMSAAYIRDMEVLEERLGKPRGQKPPKDAHKNKGGGTDEAKAKNEGTKPPKKN